MIIKEYRLIMPMTVQEYQIGQLYTIQKKSRQESEGAGSGVEIIKNEPYEDESKNEKGQYTFKIFHVEHRLPNHLKKLVVLLFPKSALLFEEEGWNCYPYTRTKYRHKLFTGFSIEMETQFSPDLGDNDNVFNLNKSELSRRIVEYVDIVNDTVAEKDYKEEEDPKLYKSNKTGRGPLGTDWIENLRKNQRENKVTYMCAYKLCRVECNIWGLQAKLEKMVCESVIRNMLFMTHRQAWCWQDEYADLSIDEVRQLEAETQEILNDKMRENKNGVNNRSIKKSSSKSSLTTSNSKSSKDKSHSDISPSATTSCLSLLSQQNDDRKIKSIINEEPSLMMNKMISIHEESIDVYNSPNSSECENEDEFGDSISLQSEEFFDAKSISSFYSRNELSKHYYKNDNIKRTSSSAISISKNNNHESFNKREIFNTQLSLSLPIRTTLTEKSVDTLVFILHGDDTGNTNNNFETLKATFDDIIQTSYPHIEGRVEYHLVACENLSRKTLSELSLLSVASNQQHLNSLSDMSNESIPFYVLPFFAVSKVSEYSHELAKVVQTCNEFYRSFIACNPNFYSNGQVVIIGDSMGSIFGFDAISTRTNPCTPSTPFTPSTISNDNFGTTSLNASKTENLYLSQMSCPATSSNSSKKSSSSENSMSESIDHLNSSAAFPFNSSTQLDFNVSHFFTFGSLLGLLLVLRKNAKNQIPAKLNCKQMYNLIHYNDPLAIRIEPLLCKEFSKIEPCKICSYTSNPYGDGTQFYLDYYLTKNTEIFQKENHHIEKDSFKDISEKWWGIDRIDYVLYAPVDSSKNTSKETLPYVMNSCFWESNDAAAFILRTIIKMGLTRGFKNQTSKISLTSEKWKNRSNRVKLRNLTPNHRANDVISIEDHDQLLKAKFSYGALDLSLSGEMVDIYISKNKEWKYYGCERTDSHGKLKFKIPNDKRLQQDHYTVKMIVKCDHSAVKFNICILPPKIETVVFSIDGSFAANISLSGTDPKIRAGAVDIVRYWQELGYLILYCTARPDIQQARVTNWLEQHNFPKGLTFFSDGLSTVPFRQKAETLKRIVNENQLVIKAGYGAARDISMYKNLNLDSESIFVIGKFSKKKYSKKAVLLDSYVSHLITLKDTLRSTNGNARLILKKLSLSSRNLNHTLNEMQYRDTDVFFSNTSHSLFNTPRRSINNFDTSHDHSKPLSST